MLGRSYGRRSRALLQEAVRSQQHRLGHCRKPAGRRNGSPRPGGLRRRSPGGGEDPPPPPEFARPPSKTVEIERELDISEAYLFVGVLGPDYNDPGQYAADVLTQILGQGIHPMMTVALKNSRRAGVNSAHLSYIALKRAGAFVAYITLNHPLISVAKRETITFLKESAGRIFPSGCSDRGPGGRLRSAGERQE